MEAMPMSAPRVLFASLYHETHSFVRGLTTLAQCDIAAGTAMMAARGDSSPLGGALATADELGWEVVPTLGLSTDPGPILADDVFDFFWRQFLTRARQPLAAGLDGIYLALHGAMITESIEDVEGEFLCRLRQIPGAEDLPIFGVFDLHGNLTEAMMRHADGLVAYRENPHTDARASAQRAARLLHRAIQEKRRPKQYLAHAPMLLPPTGTGTANEPMRSLEAKAREWETRNPDFWAVNINGGFAFGDCREAGLAFSVVSVGPEADARAVLAELVSLAWKLRAEGFPRELSVEEALSEAMSHASGLTVIAEPSDNIGGGAPGDGTGILRGLLACKAENAAVAMADAEAVQALRRIDPGQRMRLAIGGKGSDLDEGPVELELQLISRNPGRFELEDKQSHLAAGCGDWFDMGPCAVVRHEGILLLLTTNRTPPLDLGQWRSQGIAPEELSILGVKAAVAHRRAYDPIASRQIWVNTPGPCTSDLRSLPFQRIRRPIWPLDEISDPPSA